VTRPNRAPFIKPNPAAVDRLLALTKSSAPQQTGEELTLKSTRFHHRTLAGIITVYSISIAVTSLYVPWAEFYGTRYAPRQIPLGYAFLWDPPGREASVDFGRLLLEFLAITAIYFGASVWIWFGQRRARSEKASN